MTSRAFELAQITDEDGDISITGNTSITGDLSFDGTGFLKIPAGNTAVRDAISGTTGGMIRFNTTLNKYEGYHQAEWINFSDVRDKDGDTKITVHEAWGGDQDELKFYAGDGGSNNERMKIDATSITSSTTTHTIGASHLALNAAHTVLSGNLTVSGTTTTISSTQVTTADKLIEVSKTGSPSTATATGSGIFVNNGTSNNIMAYDETTGGFLFQRQAGDNSANLKATGNITVGGNVLNFGLGQSITNETSEKLTLTANSVQFGGNKILNSAGEDTITLDSNQNITIGTGTTGTLTIKGNVIKNSGGATAITMSTDSTNPSVTTPAALIAGGQITTTQLKATTGAGANKMLKSDANGLLSYVSFGVFASDGVTRLGP